jgi:hypothetical protein
MGWQPIGKTWEALPWRGEAAALVDSGEPAARGGGEEVLGRHGDVVSSIREQRGGVAHRGGCSMAVGGQPEGIGVERVADGRWWPVVGAGRRSVSGWCSGWCRRGQRRTSAGWRHGGSWRQRRSSDSSLRHLCSMTRWLAQDWKVEEALVAQLLGCSRHNGRAQSTAANLMRSASRETRQHKESGTERGSLRRELAADKGGRGRGWSATHVEAVLHDRRVEVGGRWHGGMAARGERGDGATCALGYAAGATDMWALWSI